MIRWIRSFPRGVSLLFFNIVLSQQGITLFTGMPADRLGYKLMLICGVFIKRRGKRVESVAT